jgi:hypothetical protein
VYFLERYQLSGLSISSFEDLHESVIGNTTHMRYASIRGESVGYSFVPYNKLQY